ILKVVVPIPASRPLTSRLILLAGFGGLLLLAAFAGFDGIQALSQIRAANDRIREDFLTRTRLLERIRGDVYVSGTYVRDYLLEPEPGKAEGHRDGLLESRRDMDRAMGNYRALLTTQEATPFRVLEDELSNYWNVLEPVLTWNPEQRRKAGFRFLSDEVFPRRMSMLRIADQIGAINESQMNAGKVRVEQTFTQLRGRLTVVIALTTGLGLLLATFSM